MAVFRPSCATDGAPNEARPERDRSISQQMGCGSSVPVVAEQERAKQAHDSVVMKLTETQLEEFPPAYFILRKRFYILCQVETHEPITTISNGPLRHGQVPEP